MQFTPQLVKSLMHRKVIKISSGGVHNICIVEPQPGSLMEETYKQFMAKQFTDVVFTGFYQSYDQAGTQATNTTILSEDQNLNDTHSYDDEDQNNEGSSQRNQANEPRN